MGNMLAFTSVATGAVKTTRHRLIDAAHDLFYREGFIAVGLDRVIADVGVTKTTFYNHFESKDDLILAVLEYHDIWWQETFARLLSEHGGECPRAQLEATFDVLDAMFHDEEFRGCIFVNVVVEFPSEHDPAHQAAMRNKRAMEAIIRDMAVRAGASDPAAFAEEFSLLIEGALVTAHVTTNPQTALIARRTAKLLLDKYLPPVKEPVEPAA